MIYHKFKVDDRQTVINELYDDELVTYCGDCRVEIPVELSDLKFLHDTGADMAGTTFYCQGCSKVRRDKRDESHD